LLVMPVVTHMVVLIQCYDHVTLALTDVLDLSS